MTTPVLTVAQALITSDPSYTITDTATNIESTAKGAQKAIAAATAISVTGTVTATDLTKFKADSYASKFNLSAASIIGVLTVAQALFAKTQLGTYATLTISDAAANLEGTATGTQAAIAAASAINVTGAVVASDLSAFIADSYASKINLTHASISGNITIAEAAYASAQDGTYNTNISDTAAHIEGSTTGVALGDIGTFYVTGAVTATDVDKFIAGTITNPTILNKINLSTATTVLGSSGTQAEISYIAAHHGTYAISDTYANILTDAASNNIVFKNATLVKITGTITQDNLDSLKANSYANKENFSLLTAVTITNNTTNALNASDANYLLANALKTTVKVTISDTLSHLLTIVSSNFQANLANFSNNASTATVTDTANADPTDKGLTATIKSSSAAKVDLVITGLTNNLVINNAEASNLTNIDVTHIDSTSGAFGSKTFNVVVAPSGDEFIYVDGHSIELVGVTNVALVH